MGVSALILYSPLPLLPSKQQNQEEVLMRIGRRLEMMIGVALLGTGIASAASPHFIRAESSINSVTGTMTCSWKEAGLGDNLNIDYKCESQMANATYVCVNRGGTNPFAANKTNVSGPVSATGTFASGKNGQITESLTVSPPGPGTFSCPNGQSLQLAQVSYAGVFITDLTNDISEQLANQSTGCLLPQVRGACE